MSFKFRKAVRHVLPMPPSVGHGKPFPVSGEATGQRPPKGAEAINQHKAMAGTKPPGKSENVK